MKSLCGSTPYRTRGLDSDDAAGGSIRTLGWVFAGVFCIAAVVAQVASATDPEGCLFCHRYPGLVSVDAAGEMTILHIDEERYLRSTHGKLACRRCHAEIQQVPHAGRTEVNCNGRCHTDPKTRKKADAFPLQQMHEGQQSAILRLEDHSSCRICHPLYSHSENVRVRAFLNMHTGFMICEVCHLKKTGFENVVYGWMHTENAVFKGVPYGTYFDPGLRNEKSAHFISRIAPYELRNGEKQLLMDTWDADKAAAFDRDIPRGSPQWEEHMDFFHRDVNRKEISVACNECHAANGILDLESLGFDRTEIDNLIQLNIKGLVTKYETFYFPHLLD